MISKRELRAIEKASEKFKDAHYRIPYTQRPFIELDDTDTNFKTLDDIAEHYKLDIVYLSDVSIRSRDYGRNLFIRKFDTFVRFHQNIGQLLKLPAGLNKLVGPIHDLREILKKSKIRTKCTSKFCSDSDLDGLERKYNVSFQIWSKTKASATKSNFKCIRKCATLNKVIKLHLDTYSGHLFLISDEKLYFRSYLKKMKNVQ